MQWLVRAPFSIYLGWICVATIANASALLIDLDWALVTRDTDWAVIMLLLVGTGLSAAVSLLRRDWLFNLVIVWAFVGVFAEQRCGGAYGCGIVALVRAALAAAGLVAGSFGASAPSLPPLAASR